MPRANNQVKQNIGKQVQIPGVNNDVKRFAHDLKERRAEHCIDPTRVLYQVTVNGIGDRMIRCIDEFVWRAMVTRPDSFQIRSGEQPLVFPNFLRAAWYSCFQYYMWRSGSVTGDYNQSVTWGSFKLPIGLAKLFQQCAPYVDTATGSTYSYALNVDDPEVFVYYPSVDTRVSGSLQNQPYYPYYQKMNSPVDRYLICASNQNGLLESGASQSCQASSVGDFSEDTFSNVFKSGVIDSMLILMQNLFENSIAVDDIPRYAPDASAYCYVTLQCVQSPSPYFSKSIACMLGKLVDYTDPPDRSVNTPYDKPLPVVRCEFTNDQNKLFGTLRAVYATMTSFAEKFVTGRAKRLMDHAGEFSGATSFSYRSYEIHYFRVSCSLFSVFRTNAWIGNSSEDLNAMFSFCYIFWGSYLQRLVPWQAMVHFPDVTINIPSPLTVKMTSCFYSASSSLTSIRLPATLATLISSLGPYRVGKRMIFPGISPSNYPPNNSINAVNTWTKSLTSSGTWLADQDVYALSCYVDRMMTIRLPARTDPLTYISPFPIQSIGGFDVPGNYGVQMVDTAPLFADYYTNLYPDGLGSDRWTTVSKSILGNAQVQATKPSVALYTEVVTASSWQNYFMGSKYRFNYKNARAWLCVNSEDALHSVLYGSVITSTASYSALPFLYQPLAVEYAPILVDPLTNLQATMNSSTNSQFQGMTLAMLTAQSKSKNSYEVSSKILNERLNASSTELSPSSEPNYASIDDWVRTTAHKGFSLLVPLVSKELFGHFRRVVTPVVGQAISGFTATRLQSWLGFDAPRRQRVSGYYPGTDAQGNVRIVELHDEL